jgi:uncharacterized protein involved in exopolysaccharide biosynthesis
MDENFDVQRYLKILARYWRLIAALTLGAAAIAFVVSALMPPVYEAMALVIATEPLYQLQFDSRIANTPNTDQNSPNKALPQLATADTVIQQLFDQFRNQLGEPDMTLAGFKGKLSARAGADPSVIQLTVSDEDAQLATLMSNAWAVNFVTFANELFQQHESGLTFFETQASDAKLTLANAEQALINYQSQYQGTILASQLQANTAELSNALQTRTSLRTLMANVGLLQERLAGQTGTTPANLSDDLSSLLLQLSSLNVTGSVPLQIQLTDSALSSGKTVDTQRAFLAGLLTSLQTRIQQTEDRINALQPQILSFQQKVQAASTEMDRLTRERDIARDTYLTLAKKVNETQISAKDTSGQLRTASSASIPTQPVGPRKTLNTVWGGCIGMMIGLAIAYLNGLRAGGPLIHLAQVDRTRVVVND